MKTEVFRPEVKAKKGYDRCHVNGEWIHLGRTGSIESARAYVRLLERLAANPGARGTASELLVGELCRDYLKAAPFPPGKRKQHKRACAMLTENYTDIYVNAFGSGSLKAWLLGLARREKPDGTPFYSVTYLNMLLAIIRAVWRWGVEMEKVDVDRLTILETVRGLGEHEARPAKKVKPVDDRDVEAVLPHLPRSVADLVQVQRLTGARPSELFGLRPCDLDRESFDDVWVYRPVKHKSSRKRKSRNIYFGPQAQAVLENCRPGSDDGLFFPVRKREFALRICPVYPSETIRREREAARRTPRPIGQPYLSTSYRRAILRACERTGTNPWNPYQLRHTRGTEVRASDGLEAAGAMLGHDKLSATEIYAARNEGLAVGVAARSG